MKIINRWIIIGIGEIILCFWLLGTAADLVSAPSNSKVLLGLGFYTLGLIIIPGGSIWHVSEKIYRAKIKQREIKTILGEDVSLLKLLDTDKLKK